MSFVRGLGNTQTLFAGSHPDDTQSWGDLAQGGIARCSCSAQRIDP